MSKNRKIPFGYCMKNGEITTIPNEVFAVVKIFDSYVSGKSLLEIAKDMQNGTWSCKTYRCSEYGYYVTDNTITSAVVNILNLAIADVSLINVKGEISVYSPDGNISRQVNEINRLMDLVDIEYDRIKTEIFRLAEMKYDCCKYYDVPQKTEYLKLLLSTQRQLNDLDNEVLKKCVKRIIAYHNSMIEIEFINGVKLRNEVR